MSTIGIKIANGDYYPIIDTETVGRKRVVLTTVKDNQESVQIDLYKGEGEDLSSAMYVGSLILENLAPAGRGEPELEFIVGVDEDNNMTATVGDGGSGEKQTLSLSLDSVSEESDFELPDLDLDSSIEPSSPVTSFEEDEAEEDFSFDEDFAGEEFPSATFDEEEAEFEEEPPPVYERRTHPGLLIIFVLLGLIIIGLLAFLIYRSFQGEETPALFARFGGNRTEQVEDPAEDEPAEEPAAAAETTPAEEPAETTTAEEQPAPEKPEKPKETETILTEKPAPPPDGKIGGVWYWIKWGDTLWDLSYSFYRTPWLYGKIAAANNIGNPDVIFANTRLFIPEL